MHADFEQTERNCKERPPSCLSSLHAPSRKKNHGAVEEYVPSSFRPEARHSPSPPPAQSMMLRHVLCQNVIFQGYNGLRTLNFAFHNWVSSWAWRNCSLKLRIAGSTMVQRLSLPSFGVCCGVENFRRETAATRRVTVIWRFLYNLLPGLIK
jgi:hypothetical protein